MIAYLRGQIRYKSTQIKKDNFAVVDVNGVGYKVFAPDNFLNGMVIGSEAELFIYTQVAETALDLYGFASREELEFFELLLTISGIGPHSALDILKKAKLEDLVKAVETGNHEVLAKVSGIGPKTAEKVVIGLKGKLGGGFSAGTEKWNDDFGDALEALMSLGYSSFDARKALSQTNSIDAGDKIKEALKILGRK
ncbi:MAG: Holliday junction branch migration protein RuvA [Candidatus Buchananbacteria bacterium]|jgi:Holliday junction DNA helicase RuvA